MKWKAALGGFALAAALALGGTLALMPNASAQQTGESTKRKVKTRVYPEYPPLAKQMNVTGKVKIEATIAPDGHVTGTKIVGGSPLLVGAAVDAAKKWRFEPAAKETSEIIEFEFSAQN
jgi:TonB family protein